MTGRLLICLIVSLVVGIMAGYYLPLPLWIALIPFLAGILLFVSGIILIRRNPFGPRHVINESIAILVFIGIGIFTSSLNRPSHTSFRKGSYLFTGTVEDYRPMGYGDKLLVHLDRLTFLNADGSHEPVNIDNVNAFITVKNALNVSYGNAVTGRGDLADIAQPGNYYNQDYIDYLKRRHIFLNGFADTVSVAQSEFPVISSKFKSVRDEIEIFIENTSLSSKTKNFIISILLGDKSYISNEERITFADAGIAHIFAVSGFHVSMIAAFMLGILSLLFLKGMRKWKYMLCIPLIWGYILLVGASPATCRAGIMITIGMTALFLERKINPLKSLGWAIIFILAFSPLALFDVGFQLSVVCVGSLLFIAAPMNFIDHRSHPRIFKIVSIALVALTAAFSSWMICAFYFHRFSLMFLPLNLLAVPLLPLYVIVVIIYLGVYLLGIDLSFLASILDKVYALFLSATEYITSNSHTFDNVNPGLLSVFLWVAGLIVTGYVLKGKRPLKRIWLPTILYIGSVICLFLIPSSQPTGFIIQRNSKAVTLMYYSEGNETLLTLPDGHSSKTSLNGMEIVSIRNGSLSSQTESSLSSADLVVIGSGCRELPDLYGKIKKGCIIVTHPTLHWRYEKKMMAQAADSGLKLHSIRYDGPLNVFD